MQNKHIQRAVGALGLRGPGKPATAGALPGYVKSLIECAEDMQISARCANGFTANQVIMMVAMAEHCEALRRRLAAVEAHLGIEAEAASAPPATPPVDLTGLTVMKLREIVRDRFPNMVHADINGHTKKGLIGLLEADPKPPVAAPIEGLPDPKDETTEMPAPVAAKE